MVLDNWSPLITSVTRIDSKSAHPCSYEFAKTNNRCHITVHNLKESVAMNCNGWSTTLVFLRLSRAASSSKPSNVNGGGLGRWRIFGGSWTLAWADKVSPTLQLAFATSSITRPFGCPPSFCPCCDNDSMPYPMASTLSAGSRALLKKLRNMPRTCLGQDGLSQ